VATLGPITAIKWPDGYKHIQEKAMIFPESKVKHINI
jgi:hypothetical protein